MYCCTLYEIYVNDGEQTIIYKLLLLFMNHGLFPVSYKIKLWPLTIFNCTWLVGWLVGRDLGGSWELPRASAEKQPAQLYLFWWTSKILDCTLKLPQHSYLQGVYSYSLLSNGSKRLLCMSVDAPDQHGKQFRCWAKLGVKAITDQQVMGSNPTAGVNRIFFIQKRNSKGGFPTHKWYPFSTQQNHLVACCHV